MGTIDFTRFSKQQDANAQSENKTKKGNVSFFNLRNDGDEAIVRIMHDTPETFEGYTVHNVTLNGKTKKIKCLREDGREPLENCPFCAAKKPLQSRMFVHLIEYKKDNQGNIVAVPEVWERPASFAQTLINRMNEYGSLSETIYKIKRNGVAGSQGTTYDPLYCNPMVYRNELYPVVEDAFKDYSAIKTKLVLEKTAEDMQYYLTSGTFPEAQQQSQQAQSVQEVAKNYQQPINTQATRTYTPYNQTPQNNEQQFRRPNSFNNQSWGEQTATPKRTF